MRPAISTSLPVDLRGSFIQQWNRARGAIGIRIDIPDNLKF